MENKSIDHSGFSPVEKSRHKESFDVRKTLSNLTRYQKTYIQMGVCALVLLSVLTFKAIDTPFSNKAINRMNTVISGDVEIDEDLGRLKFVSKEVKSVFNDGITMPIETLSENIGFDENSMIFCEMVDEQNLQ